MAIRYILKQLLMPPGLLLLLLLAAWCLRRRFPRIAGGCFAGGLLGLWLLSLPVSVEYLARLLEREPALPEAQWAALAGRVEAIVVLGAGRERDDPAWGAINPARWRSSACATRRAWPGPRVCRC